MSAKVILLAEDNPDDAFIFKIMFGRAKVPHTLNIVQDGQQAIDWLDGKAGYDDRERFPLPEILLLDLKMPIRNGFEVLEWVRAQPQFEKLQVIVLSSSDDNRDVKRAYQLGATNYFVKSPQLQDVIQYLRSS